MFSRFTEFLAGLPDLSQKERVLLAVSGGVDSMVMLNLFVSAGYQPGVAHVNHGMRAEESEADAQFVQRAADSLDLEFHLLRIDLKSEAQSRGKGIQETGRLLRYAWLEELAQVHGYAFIATAHHLDDSLETVVMNALRGSGPESLGGIPPKRGRIIRPLIHVERASIEAYAAEKGISYREDSSNQQLSYTRNRVRKLILPGIERLSPGFRESLREKMQNVRRQLDALDPLLERERNLWMTRDERGLSIKLDCPEEELIFWLLFGSALEQGGFRRSRFSEIQALRSSLTGARLFSFSHELLRDRESLLLLSREEIGSGSVVIRDIRQLSECLVGWELEELTQLPKVFGAPEEEVWIDAAALEFPLELRHWQEGDRMVPIGMKGSMLLSDFFVQLKLDRDLKQRVLLLCKGREVLWVVGYRISNKLKVGESTGQVLHFFRDEKSAD